MTHQSNHHALSGQRRHHPWAGHRQTSFQSAAAHGDTSRLQKSSLHRASRDNARHHVASHTPSVQRVCRIARHNRAPAYCNHKPRMMRRSASDQSYASPGSKDNAANRIDCRLLPQAVTKEHINRIQCLKQEAFAAHVQRRCSDKVALIPAPCGVIHHVISQDCWR